MSFFLDISEDIQAHAHKPSQSPLMAIYYILFHPSVRMLFSYRLQQLFSENNPVTRLIKRALWMGNTRKSGCHLSHFCVIEPGVKFPHATGIVIGAGSHVKSGAVIYQNVTLGVKNLEKENLGKGPIIEEGATIFANSLVTGSITVGKGATIGALSLVRKDVAANTIVSGNPARALKD